MFRALTLSLVCLAPLPAAAQATAPALPLEAPVRDASAEAVQATLYDLIALRQAAHQAHWNVIGSNYYQLHEFLGELYSDVAPYIDTVAERGRALGVAVEGNPGAVAEASGFEPMPVRMTDGTQTLQEVADRWATVSARLYDRLDAVSDDMPTQDLLIAVTALLDKQLWQLRSHLQ